VVLGIALLPGLASGEEGGSGHYLPGSMASFIDGVPLTETLLARLNVVYYDGSIGASKPLPISGLTTLGAHATSWGLGLTVLWRPPLDLSERWSYAMSGTIPFLFMDVSAEVATTVPGVGARRDSVTNGIGDMVLMPLMLNYHVFDDFNVNARLGIYAPTGSYELGRLANTGKNYWTFEPVVGLMYFGQKNGIEASLFFGLDFNTQNPATEYTSGTQLHLDGTVAQHFPWLGGLPGVGISAFYYKQVSPDSGAGATLGAFEAMDWGLGPVLSYVSKIAEHDVILELKWLHEFDTQYRLQGDIVWFKGVFKF
jgi:hypothetical protein